MDWTDAQHRGIETVGRSLLVSAAAGSGKTAVLAERCAHLLCDAPEPYRCDVNELLVVTFTNAAAAEMRNRIEKALRQRLAERGGDDRLARQLLLLDRAQISTIHSFCGTLLRKHFNLLGLDPNFRTLDEEESLLTRIETARQLLADRYETDESSAFQRLIDAWAGGDDERILWRVIHAHDMLCSVVDPDGWLDQTVARIEQAASGTLLDSGLGRELAELIHLRLNDFIRRCAEASGLLGRSRLLVPYAEFLNELIVVAQKCIQTFAVGGFDDLVQTIREPEDSRPPRMSGSIPGKEQAKELVDSLRAELRPRGGLFELCRFTSKEWQDGLKGLLSGATVFVDLVKQFTDRYRKAKREVGALDFGDLERMTLDVLRDPNRRGALAPSGTARTYQRQFKHVLVDEYQDINEVQDAILTLVSRECKEQTADTIGQGSPQTPENSLSNLFCVGDVKQSIYRFRLADPGRFLERNRRLRAGNQTQGEVIDLQANFRSRAPLLAALNAVFERLMTTAAAEIQYDASHRLHPGATYPSADKIACFEGAPIELHLLPDELNSSDGTAVPSRSESDEIELERAEREAAFVARRIAQLMAIDGGTRTHVLDRSGDQPILRPLQFRDIVILLRAPRYKSEQFVDVLRAAGIPVHSETGSGFFNSTEIRDMLALLSLLDNQQQDVPLAAVLRSPLWGLAEPEDSLARIRVKYPGGRDEHIPFHLAVVRYAAKQPDELAAHLRDLLDQLHAWRDLAWRRPLAELIWTIYTESGYLAFCAGLPDGEQRAANLIRLHERARQFGSFQRQGLRRFLQFLQTLEQEQEDVGQPSIASEADDVVKVMSIHRAKGLEFPVVIVPDLGKRHNLQDLASPILIDRQAGLGMLCVDEALRIRYPSIASVLVGERIRRQAMAEELRVLYVALTRAREHLIMVGTAKTGAMDKWRAHWARHPGPVPAQDVLRAGSMLEWIGPVAAATEHLKDAPFTISVHDEAEARTLAGAARKRERLTESQQKLARLEPLATKIPPHPHAEAVRQRLTARYPHEHLTQLAAARTVASLTKTGRTAFAGHSPSRKAMVEFTDQLPAPRCAQETLTLSAAEIGSATHMVLQRLNFKHPSTRDDLTSQIREMIARKHITSAAAESVDLDSIQWLMTTAVGELLRASAVNLWRELPISFPMWEGPSTDDPLDQVMVRGRIDVMIPGPDGLVVIDYKTDRVTAETLDQRAEFHRPQVEAYSRAIADMVCEPVKEVHLVFLSAREIRTLRGGG